MGNYADIIDKMVWSYSRLSLYAQCKYAFYLKYIVNDPEQYLPEGNYYAEVGSYVHEILAKVFGGELTIDEASEYYANNFENNVFYRVKDSIMEKTYESCANYFSDVDLKWIEDYEILGVEMETTQNIRGYNFIGFIDLLLRDKNTGEITIVDHKSAAYPLSKKTGKVLKNSEKNFSSYKKQMYLYSYAVKQIYGVYPKWIMWNHFKSNDIVKIPFDIDEYNKAIDWLIETIHAIENDEEFSEGLDYFYCHTLCDFRNSCEYIHSKAG